MTAADAIVAVVTTPPRWHDDGVGIFIVLLLIPAGLFVWMIIDPRGAWKATSAWQYKNPEMNEPSDAAFMIGRISSVLGLILVVVMMVVIANAA